MSKFFIRRPIVAIVIAILTVIVGSVALLSLPTSQFPNIVPPEILVTATYPDRAADERRRQYDLHGFGEREQRRGAALR
jgi:multidrug efflux pump subunit AcrB